MAVSWILAPFLSHTVRRSGVYGCCRGLALFKMMNPTTSRLCCVAIALLPQDYRKRLENQKGAVLLSETKNNKFKVRAPTPGREHVLCASRWSCSSSCRPQAIALP